MSAALGIKPFERQKRSRFSSVSAPLSAEHLLFRYDPRRNPPITYWSLPHGCTGGADTLDEARKAYRATLTGLLDAGRRELPTVVEHLEALIGDMWVRTQVGAVHRDAVSDRMLVQTLLAAGPAPDAMRVDLQHATRAGARPIVVIVEPHDAVASVLDQMRDEDTVLVVHSDVQNVLEWVVIHGSDAPCAEDTPRIATHADLGTMPISVLTTGDATGNPRVVRLLHTHRKRY
jgi:hypothetical protein